MGRRYRGKTEWDGDTGAGPNGTAIRDRMERRTRRVYEKAREGKPEWDGTQDRGEVRGREEAREHREREYPRLRLNSGNKLLRAHLIVGARSVYIQNPYRAGTRRRANSAIAQIPLSQPPAASLPSFHPSLPSFHPSLPSFLTLHSVYRYPHSFYRCALGGGATPSPDHAIP